MSESITPWVNYVGDYVPKYATPASAGCDLQSSEDVKLAPGEWKLIPAGIFLEIPDYFMGQICPRSGIALKHGVTVLNNPGIVDSDYRNEVKVILINHGKEEYSIKKGDRIAQIIFVPIFQGHFCKTDKLTQTTRSGGFGSTGV